MKQDAAMAHRYDDDFDERGELMCRQAVKFWGRVGSIRRLGPGTKSRRSGGIVRR